MGKDKLFKLESKEDILKMKAIYRFIHDKNMTPEQVLDEYLTDEEKAELKMVEGKITLESIKPFIVKDIEKKKGKK